MQQIYDLVALCSSIHINWDPVRRKRKMEVGRSINVSKEILLDHFKLNTMLWSSPWQIHLLEEGQEGRVCPCWLTCLCSTLARRLAMKYAERARLRQRMEAPVLHKKTQRWCFFCGYAQKGFGIFWGGKINVFSHSIKYNWRHWKRKWASIYGFRMAGGQPFDNKIMTGAHLNRERFVCLAYWSTFIMQVINSHSSNGAFF